MSDSEIPRGNRPARASGVLLHFTSLPSPFGVGDLGPAAHRFADFLSETRQKYWQILPLNPSGHEENPSPYNSVSALAGNPLFISPELLVAAGWLEAGEIQGPNLPGDRVNYPEAIRWKQHLLARAGERFRAGAPGEDYARFARENASWLEDYALFAALRAKFGDRAWNEWPRDLRDREPAALSAGREKLAREVEQEKFLQFLFFSQWAGLREHCRRLSLSLIGDVPIYVDFQSVDVWTHPGFFKLGPDREPLQVAGVPPDYFSRTGQLWGNPVYDWEALRRDGYSWWVERMARNFQLFDLVRIDHFRGLAGYWEVPAGEKTALTGRWQPGPGEDFFRVLREKFPELPVLAEDLGTITADVVSLREQFGFPGMKVLLFGFGGDPGKNPNAPHNFEQNCFAYTGTHDNNTIRGWWEGEATPEEKRNLGRYLGREVGAETVSAELVRLLFRSAARTAIVPLQDLLGLDGRARMNRPATTRGNYEWRFLPEALTPELRFFLRELTEICGRG